MSGADGKAGALEVRTVLILDSDDESIIEQPATRLLILDDTVTKREPVDERSGSTENGQKRTLELLTTSTGVPLEKNSLINNDGSSELERTEIRAESGTAVTILG
jgi:hypothetical protein